MSSSDPDILRPVTPDWSTALVLVCSECEGGKGADLAAELKQAMKEGGHRKDVRVARCRCLGICPKRGISVTVTAPDRPATSYVAAGKGRHVLRRLLDAILKP